MRIVFAVVSAALLFAIAQAGHARSLCNQENLAKYAGWCLDPQQTLSDFQKAALADVIKGRFCSKGELVRDGLFRCLGHDADALKNLLACSADDTLGAASQLLAADDSRKPADCAAK